MDILQTKKGCCGAHISITDMWYSTRPHSPCIGCTGGSLSHMEDVLVDMATVINIAYRNNTGKLLVEFQYKTNPTIFVK